MEITTENHSGWTIVEIDGDLVMRELFRARQVFDSMYRQEGLKMAVDFSRTRLVDSSAIGFIIAAKKQIDQSKGAMIIMGASADVLEVFTITGIHKIIPLYDSREAFERAIADGRLQ